MNEDSTKFKGFHPAPKSLVLPLAVLEANLELWRLLKNKKFAGTYNEYERTLLSFQLVLGWCEFYQAYRSGRITAAFVIAKPERAALALGYFDEVGRTCGILEFHALKVTKLPVIEVINQPQLSREISLILCRKSMLSAGDIIDLFAQAGHDLVWRVMADGEMSPDLVHMTLGYFLQFRHLLESDKYGMITDCRQTDDGVVLHFSFWLKDSAHILKRAIADIALKLDVREIRWGNCVLTVEQFVRVVEEGPRCLSKIYPSREPEII